MEITPIQEKEIRVFETVLANTEKIIPFDRFYVALYDRRNASLYYPIVRLEDESCLKLPDLAEGPWAPRPFAPDNQWPDCLWRSEVDVPNGSNPQSWLAERKLWQKDEKDEQRIGLNYHLAPYPRSWLIAPLKARGGAVMGVLVAEDLHREGAYGADLQTWFATATNRVAGTLSSLRLVESLRTVNRVGQRLTAGARQSVADILELLHSEAGQLMDTRDIFVALYDAGRQQLSFPLAYFNGEPQNWEARTVVIGDKPGGGLTEEVIRKPGTLCPADVEKWYKDNKIKPRVLPVPKSWLGMPLLSGERVLGVIALQNDEVERLYSADDQEILEAMANQVSAALANAQLVERLQAVNEVGQRLTSGTQLGEGEILQLIYEQAGKLMDTRDMFVAFYDAGKQELSFPLFYVDGKPIEWESRSVNLEDPLQRKLTEEVLYHRQLLNVPNFSQWFEERGRPVPAEPPKSWLGVPLMVEDRVLGVIALQNDEIEGLYGPDDEAVLQAMASQAATALENARLLEQERQLREQERQLRLEMVEAQKKIIATERMAAVASVAGEIVHKMNNLAGTLPARVQLIKEKLDPLDIRDQKIGEIADMILQDSLRLLEQAKRIRESTAPEAITREDANVLLQTALERVKYAFREKFDSDRITLRENYTTDPLYVEVQKNPVVSALENVMRNAVEAMLEGGTLTVESSLQYDKIVLRIVDTGKGISPEILPRLFDPFYTTKPAGMGYGLWQSRTVVRSLGGDLFPEVSNNKGSTFVFEFRSLSPRVDCL